MFVIAGLFDCLACVGWRSSKLVCTEKSDFLEKQSSSRNSILEGRQYKICDVFLACVGFVIGLE